MCLAATRRPSPQPSPRKDAGRGSASAGQDRSNIGYAAETQLAARLLRTPYAALQTQMFHTPTYSETDLTGGGFALAYNAMSVTDTRTELGARFDNLQVVNRMPLLLHGRIAWAHDFVSNPNITAAFQALPGAAFTVNGAPLPHDSALLSASAELKVRRDWTVGLKLDGEFASGAQTDTGTGTLRDDC